MDYVGVFFLFVALQLLGYAVLFTVVEYSPHSKWGTICLVLLPHIVVLRLRHNGGLPPLGGGDPISNASPPVAAAPHLSGEAAIRQARCGGFLGIDGRQEAVQGVASLHELQFVDGGEWNHQSADGGTLREFTAVALAGKQLLMEHPTGEGREVAFFLYGNKSSDTPTGFSEYLKGTDAKPGPAAVFATSGQQADVSMTVLERKWKIHDLIWIDAHVQGGDFFVRDMKDGRKARVCMVLGRNGDDWIVYADLRSGQGSDTLWIGQRFDAQVSLDA